MRLRRTAVALTASVALAGGLAACSDGDGQEGDTGQFQEQGVDDGGTTAEEFEPSEQEQQGVTEPDEEPGEELGSDPSEDAEPETG